MLTRDERLELDRLNSIPARKMTKADFESWCLLTSKEQPELDDGFYDSDSCIIIDGVVLAAHV